jgi:hypothetical protein
MVSTSHVSRFGLQVTKKILKKFMFQFLDCVDLSGPVFAPYSIRGNTRQPVAIVFPVSAGQEIP